MINDHILFMLIEKWNEIILIMYYKYLNDVPINEMTMKAMLFNASIIKLIVLTVRVTDML